MGVQEGDQGRESWKGVREKGPGKGVSQSPVSTSRFRNRTTPPQGDDSLWGPLQFPPVSSRGESPSEAASPLAHPVSPFTQQTPDWRCATFLEMAENNPGPDQRIVLLGKTGIGKSATGNTILGSNVFKSAMSLKSPTKTCQREETLWNGRKVVVVDTPGFFDTGVPKYRTVEELVNCMKFCPRGPHVILWVMCPGRFSQEEKKIHQLVKEVFGRKGKNYMIILFTRKDDLEGMTLEEVISYVDVSLQELVAHCGHRCLAFNNKAKGEEREAQVAELMRMIDQVVYQNGDATCYTEDMLREDINHFKKMRGLSSCSLL